MNVLGFGGSIHDFSACLSSNGKIKTYIEEERLLKVKHSLNIGRKVVLNKAADYCLKENKIDNDQIDCMVTSDIVEPAYYSKFSEKINVINHHLSHAATSYYPSPFEEAAILVVDGRGSFLPNGERETVSFYYAQDKKINELKKVSGRENGNLITNSIGKFYEEVTDLIGFGFLQDGKTMGLAPFGSDRYTQKFEEFFEYNANGWFNQSLTQLKELREFIKGELQCNSNSQQTKADLAYAVQYHVEEYLVTACNNLYNITQSDNLCLSGGVALNSVANYKILKRTPFKNVYIFPAAGDAGTAVGCSLYGYYEIMDNERNLDTEVCSPYLGKSYTDNEIFQVLEKYRSEIEVKHYDEKDLSNVASKLISEGNIIGWFQGKSEAGPRALGNRSILADPRYGHMKDTINKRIKHREAFRPFAPAILEEYVNDYFEFSSRSPYMLFVSNIKPETQYLIPSVTHVDGTGRLQTVSQNSNPPFYSLIESFYKLTNIPILLNTSFNDNGQPIVESPEDAIKTFLVIDLDYLVIGHYLIKKEKIKGDVNE
ncbi:carbamoyltransferase C-terminal domain-containing protein [Bacillus sp. SM2101]|uniref:carbamoyltransferase family protein n=1 Tax=Bacillus sp. SM2101 TaxID=2805366 RepID=UPI001BDE85FE|nr:carbamoyltransferase C-terminal domain-containing protein [Bacillus sp. SM2101]